MADPPLASAVRLPLPEDPASAVAQLGLPTGARRRAVKVTKRLPNLADIERRLAKSDTFGEHKARLAIDPRSEFMKYWDLVVVGLLVYTALITPFDMAFVPQVEGSIPWTSAAYWIAQLVNVLFIIDLLINLILAYFDVHTGAWVFTPRRIILHYVRGWFLLDLVSVIPFELLGLLMSSSEVSSLQTLRMIRLLRLAKLARIFRASRLLKRLAAQFDLSNATKSLITFIVLVLVTTHWIACSWGIVATFEDLDDSWIAAYDMVDQSPLDMYVICFYYAVLALPTGVGDIVPVNVLERAVCTIAMMIGGSVYAYVIGAVCAVVATQDPASTQFYQTLDNLNAFMVETQVPAAKKRELREYFHYCRNLFRAQHYHEVIERMSPKLRGDIAMHTHGRWICSIPFFCAKNKEERGTFVAAIASALQRQAYAPKEIIVHQGEFCEKMYIIQRGLAARLGQVLGAGRYFGEDVILHNTRRNYFVRVLTYLDVYALYKTDLEAILSNGDFPQTRKLIRTAAIKLSLSREMKRLSTQVRLAKALAAAAALQNDDQQGTPPPVEAPTGPHDVLELDGADEQLVSPLSMPQAPLVTLRSDDQVLTVQSQLRHLSGMLDDLFLQVEPVLCR